MKRTLGLLCTAAPFVAAAIAALGARHDMRLLWVALLATGVAQVAARSRANRRAAATLSFILGTLVGCAVEVILGARAPFGVIAVALVVAAFATAGAFL